MAGASSSTLGLTGAPLFDTSGGIAGFGGTGLTLGGIGTVAGDIGGAIGAFQQAAGYRSEAEMYGSASAEANLEAQNIEHITDVQKFQLGRKVALSESATQAAAARNGLQEVGSVSDILRESAIQGYQAQQDLMFNAQLKENQYREQAAADNAEAQAANSAAHGSILGGLFKAASGAIAIAGML